MLCYILTSETNFSILYAEAPTLKIFCGGLNGNCNKKIDMYVCVYMYICILFDK